MEQAPFLDDLVLFKHVAQAGGLAAAALSRKMQTLERQLGRQCFSAFNRLFVDCGGAVCTGGRGFLDP